VIKIYPLQKWLGNRLSSFRGNSLLKERYEYE